MKSLYQEYELEALIGSENIEDFDVDAIRDELTEVDYQDGNRYWRDLDADEVNAIVASHELRSAGSDRFRVWSHDAYNAAGGWSEEGEFDTLEDATAHAERLAKAEEARMAGSTPGGTAYTIERLPNGMEQDEMDEAGEVRAEW